MYHRFINLTRNTKMLEIAGGIILGLIGFCVLVSIVMDKAGL